MNREIYKTTANIIYKLGNKLDTAESKATLANLRNSIGKDLSKTVEIWPLVFAQMPEDYLSIDGNPTYEENAILTALQLYALHQQGKSEMVHKASGHSVGRAFRSIRGENETSLDRRFNTMITASGFKELTTHLRHIISIFKQKDDGKIDYAKLAEDMFWYQISLESANRMRMRWGQDYYFKPIKEKEGENDEK